MASDGKAWGIRIEVESGRQDKGVSEGEVFIYRTYIADKREGIFLTNQAVRRAIKENKLKPQYMGFATFHVFPERKKIYFQAFYPFTRQTNMPGLTPLFEGKGIASAIELRLQRDLMKRFPGFELRHSGPFLPRRQRQLEARSGSSSKKVESVEKDFEQTLKALRRARARKREEARKPRLEVVRRRLKG